MKFVFIVGARPQFIKLAPLFKRLPEQFEKLLIHTGQHYDNNMSDLFFNELEIPTPDYNLDIGSSSHGIQTGEMLKSIEQILFKTNNAATIIFGDTNSTLAGALASSKLDIPVIHIEAGLRSFNRQMPEEINRIVADHTSDYLFSPTLTATNNLISEGLESRTYQTGDIMVDSIHDSLEIAKNKSTILSNLDIKPQSYYLLTLHRPYNVDDKNTLTSILSTLGDLGEKIVFPIHPRTKRILDSTDFSLDNNIQIIEPQGYLDFLLLQRHAKKIVTDSGGIQKEAYILGTPCITLRHETEWTETIESGWNLLVPSDDNKMLEKISSFNPQKEKPDIFGTKVSSKMIEILRTI